MFSISVGNLIGINSKEFRGFALDYFKEKKDQYQNLKNLAFIGEGFRKMGISNKEYFNHTEKIILKEIN